MALWSELWAIPDDDTLKEIFEHRVVPPKKIVKKSKRTGYKVIGEVPKNEIITELIRYTPNKHPKWKFWKSNRTYLVTVTTKKIYLMDYDE